LLSKKTTAKSVLSAATRSGFMAATAGASHHQAAEFRLVNGQLVTADGGPPTVEAPAEPAGGPRD